MHSPVSGKTVHSSNDVYLSVATAAESSHCAVEKQQLEQIDHQLQSVQRDVADACVQFLRSRSVKTSFLSLTEKTHPADNDKNAMPPFIQISQYKDSTGKFSNTGQITLTLQDADQRNDFLNDPVFKKVGVAVHKSGHASLSITLGKLDKYTHFHVLKNHPRIFPTLPKAIFSFAICDIFTQEKDNAASLLDQALASKINNILNDNSSPYGILLNSDEEACRSLDCAEQLITFCAERIDRDRDTHNKNAQIKKLTEKLKMVSHGGSVIVDFSYEDGKVTHSENRCYRDEKNNLLLGKAPTVEPEKNPSFPAQLVHITKDLPAEEHTENGLSAVDILLHETSLDQHKNGLDVLLCDITQALSLALHPERITNKLINNPTFQAAYRQFLGELVKLGNGSIVVHQMKELKEANEYALNNRDLLEKEWEGIPSYSITLDHLPRVTNSALTVVGQSTDEAVETLIAAMEAEPEKRLLWVINGNNHFPTHQGLKSIVQKIAQARARISGKTDPEKMDILVISGNAAGKAPYNAGPLASYMSLHGKIKGKISEAQAIKSMLNDDSGNIAGFNVILEEDAKNTRENLTKIITMLQNQGKDPSDFIMVNSQSGLSGKRSALTWLGEKNNASLPKALYFINPDITPEEGIDTLSYVATGKMFIQATREFMNLTSDIMRKWGIPSVPLPSELITSYKQCLEAIGIRPDSTSSSDVQNIMRKLQEVAMMAHNKKLIDPVENYANAVDAYASEHANLRAQENKAMDVINLWRSRVPREKKRKRS